MPRAPIHAGGVNTQQHLVVPDDGPVDLLDSQDVLRFSVLVLDDRLHRRHLGRQVSGLRRSNVLLGSYRALPVTVAAIREWTPIQYPATPSPA
jgi:hypothetical protein